MRNEFSMENDLSSWSKQADEINYFIRKTKNISHPSLRFNKSIVLQTRYQKHLGIFLDFPLTFEKHFKDITTSVNKTIAMLQTLQKIWPRLQLMTINIAFVRQNLDYGDVSYAKGYKGTFHQKFEYIQSNAYLALSGTIKRIF